MENSILSSARIFLVDSDESVRRSMTSYYKDITRLFVAVPTAEEAFPMLDGPRWDIVISNLKLSGTNGLEFCKRVRKRKPKTKIILATQQATAALEKKAADIGITEIFSSPLTPDSLLSCLINVFSIMEVSDVPVAGIVTDGYELPETVSIMELDESMIITSFVRFNKHFKSISPETRDWIQHNFKNAWAVVDRHGQEFDLPTDEIQEEDDIIKLHQLPVTLMKLTFVRKQLIKDLKHRGFLAFEVKRKPTPKTVQQKIRQGAVRRTEAFIGKVSENIAVRDSVSDTVKGLFSGDDYDGIDTYDLVNHVERLVDSKAAQAISVIAALKKGDHLYTHCVDVGAIFLTVYTNWIKSNGIEFAFKNYAEIMMSAILHDIGKTVLPHNITESEDSFEAFSKEMKTIREHPEAGAKILSDLDLSEAAINMARYHHVKMDISLLSSYPPIMSYETVLPETRLLAIVDMFQSMVGRRPYKKSWHPPDAMKYIDQLAGLECDPQVWIAFRDAMGWYPVGSLVELNDGSQAFVVEKAYHGLRRPSVVVTRNSDDEELTHNTHFDLNTEKDIFIKKGLDHFMVYGDSAINRFVQLQVS